MNLTGSIAALVTPFVQGEVDYKALADLVEWHVSEGTSALAVCATTGESPTLSRQERYDVLAAAAASARGRLPVIAGIGTNCTREAVDLAGLARQAGADAVLHATGYYNKPTQAQIINHFRVLDQACELPILLYNIPSRTGIELTIDTVAILSELDRVRGIKDSTGQVGRVSLEMRRVRKPFAFLSGDDMTALGYFAHGGVGSISVTANVAPKAYARFAQAALEGDFATARELNATLCELHSALFIEPSPGGAKYALSRLGLCRDELRLPMTSVTEQARARIDEAMSALGLL
ncbi:4-hydroxy-tetrahydrodipicolinate synthase [Paludibacterium paludis]|uniref:4-hydroxy-tetrahydrodipicolinate synthase n=1 Tax=Paludibacterium paludis TaxID=1225769 RepID=A0A918U6W0_9NEIS|nr:4-hydroxy-tetrahydrodipicolinate synthase [Paludibacterium paludis]GGY03031.1 4-hydroxy-tetrahydrodipicolinate synthase [Paludibacterium paludis]